MSERLILLAEKPLPMIRASSDWEPAILEGTPIGGIVGIKIGFLLVGGSRVPTSLNRRRPHRSQLDLPLQHLPPIPAQPHIIVSTTGRTILIQSKK